MVCAKCQIQNQLKEVKVNEHGLQTRLHNPNYSEYGGDRGGGELKEQVCGILPP